MFFELLKLNLHQLDREMKAGSLILLMLCAPACFFAINWYEGSLAAALLVPALMLAGTLVFLGVSCQKIFFRDIFGQTGYLYMSFPIPMGRIVYAQLVSVFLMNAMALVLLGVVLFLFSAALENSYSPERLVGSLLLGGISPAQIGFIFSLGLLDIFLLYGKLITAMQSAVFVVAKLGSGGWKFFLSIAVVLILAASVVVETWGQLLLWDASGVPPLTAVSGDLLVNGALIFLLARLNSVLLEKTYELR